MRCCACTTVLNPKATLCPVGWQPGVMLTMSLGGLAIQQEMEKSGSMNGYEIF